MGHFPFADLAFSIQALCSSRYQTASSTLTFGK
jgi:hypothetical protein